MLRTLFFEYPDDPTSWLVEDEYMFGANLLVAPLFDDRRRAAASICRRARGSTTRRAKSYDGAQWHEIAAGEMPVVLLVKDHTVLPHVAVAQSTAQIDWKNVELRVFSSDGGVAEGTFILPEARCRRSACNALASCRIRSRGA